MDEDFNGTYFDGLLFTTADKKIGFGSYFTDNKYSSYGAFRRLGRIPSFRRTSARGSNGGSADYSKDGFFSMGDGRCQCATFAIAYDNGYGGLQLPYAEGRIYRAAQSSLFVPGQCDCGCAIYQPC